MGLNVAAPTLDVNVHPPAVGGGVGVSGKLVR